jgi:hypothetical protein
MQVWKGSADVGISYLTHLKHLKNRKVDFQSISPKVLLLKGFDIGTMKTFLISFS